MGFLRRLFCDHVYQFLSLSTVDYKILIHIRCDKCGKKTYRHQLISCVRK